MDRSVIALNPDRVRAQRVPTAKPPRIRRALIAFVIAASTAATAAQAQRPSTPLPAVVYITVNQQELNRSSEFIGHVQAIQSVDVRAQASGYLTQVAFKGGQDVKKGQLLYVIEPAPYEAAVAAAKAQLASAQATATQNQQNLVRQKQLYQRGTAAETTYDQAVAQAEVSQANVNAAEAQLKTAEINLGYTRITSPINGRIGATAVTAGNLVGPTTGTLTNIVQLDPIRVVFSVNGRALVAYKQEYPQATQEEINARFIPKLRLPDNSMYSQTGHIEFISNQVDATTGTIPVYADFPNPKRLLLPGMLVTAVISPETPARGFLLPAGAIQQDRQGKYVLLVGAGNKVERRDIKTGAQIEQDISVVSGLSNGDRVIVQGAQKARPGQAVKPVPESSAPTGPTATPSVVAPAPASPAMPSASKTGQ